MFHVAIDFGPWAGTYDARTNEDACFGGDGTWSASFLDAAAIPSAVSLVAAQVEGDGAPVGVLTVQFGTPPEVTVYETTAHGSNRVIHANGSLRVSDTGATAGLPDFTEATGGLEAAVERAAVVR